LCFSQAIIVISDKDDPSTSGVAIIGTALKNKKMKVFTVGVGPHVDSSQLRKAATQLDYHTSLASFNELVPFAPSMARQLCKESERKLICSMSIRLSIRLSVRPSIHPF